MKFLLTFLGLFLCFLSSCRAQIICGEVKVCVTPQSGTKRKISLRISSDQPVLNIDDGVDASGYFYNLDTDVNGILQPNAPSLIGGNKIYTDTWVSDTGSGDVQVGFPFVRTYYSSTMVCYANLQEIFADTGSNPCRTTDLVRQTKVDFALVVDTTGSMRNDIAGVKNNAIEIINALQSSSTSFRAAVVEYNDRVAPLPDAKTLLDFTDDISQVTTTINALHTLDIGGDWKECLYDGLLEANFLSWDDSARRVTITMGDAPGKVCDSGTTLADIVFFSEIVTIDITPSVRMLSRASSNVVRSSKKMTVDIPVKKVNHFTMIATKRTEIANFTEIANKTGGYSVIADTPTDVVSKIITTIVGEDPTATEIKPLTVALDCRASSPSQHAFLITNPNSVTVAANVREIYTRTNLALDAKPGINTVMLSKKPKVGLTLSWLNEHGKKKFKMLRKAGC